MVFVVILSLSKNLKNFKPKNPDVERCRDFFYKYPIIII